MSPGVFLVELPAIRGGIGQRLRCALGDIAAERDRVEWHPRGTRGISRVVAVVGMRTLTAAQGCQKGQHKDRAELFLWRPP